MRFQSKTAPSQGTNVVPELTYDAIDQWPCQLDARLIFEDNNDCARASYS